MQRQKTIALMVALIMSSTASAYALNVGVINATRPQPAAASVADVEPIVTTVVVEVPYDSGPAPVAPVAASSAVSVLSAESAAAPAPVAAQKPTVAPVVAPLAPLVQVAETTASTSPPAATTYETFSAGPAGTVVLAHTDNSIEFWAAYTANGWNYQVENSAGHEITVKYRLGESEMTFVAKLKGSHIVTVVEGPGGGGQDD